jgi:hypothetical protein
MLPGQATQQHGKANAIMESMKDNRATTFIKNEILRVERNLFIGRILGGAVGYTGITILLNSIRASVSLWIVWLLIGIQFLLYLSIFVTSLRRSMVCGLNYTLAMIIFGCLAILGRVNDWELVIIPSTVLGMIIASGRTKRIPERLKHILPQQ